MYKRYSIYNNKKNSFYYDSLNEKNEIFEVFLNEKKDWIEVLKVNPFQFTKEGKIDAKNFSFFFHRDNKMKSLPIPELGGDFSLFQKCLRIKNEEEAFLTLAFLINSMDPSVPKSGLIFTGGPGSGKSTLQANIRNILDPTSTPLNFIHKKTIDAILDGNNNYMFSYDNVTDIPNDILDLLAAIITGVGYNARKLFTDGDEYSVVLLNSVMLNSIHNPISREDLLDRCVLIELDKVDSYITRKKIENLLKENIRKNFGYILYLRLKAYEELSINEKKYTIDKYRMIDYVQIGEVITQLNGKSPGYFAEIYEENVISKGSTTIQEYPTLRKLIKNSEKFKDGEEIFNGLISDLLEELNKKESKNIKLGKAINSPNYFSRILSRCR